MSPVKQARPVDSTLGAIVSHALRLQCLTIFSDRTASPNEIANELNRNLGDVAYHVRVLAEADYIELVDIKQRRGANEHFYRAIRRPVFDDDHYATLSVDDRLPFSRQAVLYALADASLSLEKKVFVQRSDHHISRVPVLVDEQGWEELRDVYAEAFEKTRQVQEAVADRRGDDPAAPVIPARVVTMVFEMPAADS